MSYLYGVLCRCFKRLDQIVEMLLLSFRYFTVHTLPLTPYSKDVYRQDCAHKIVIIVQESFSFSSISDTRAPFCQECFEIASHSTQTIVRPIVSRCTY